MRKLLVLALAASAAIGGTTATASADAFPDVIPLPDGWRPEGITAGAGNDAFVGSLGSGAIYRVDLRTGAGEVAVPPQTGRISVGLAYDARSGLVFAAGGPAGDGYAYDADTGETVDVFDFTDEPSFVNDVVVTNDAAYFTDSFRPFLYRVALGPAGRVGAPETIALGGDFVFVPGAFNTNGIEATSDGSSLIIVHTARAELYEVDPDTGVATLIDLGGAAVTAGDGLARIGRTLYVMQNQLEQVAVVELAPDLGTGSLVGTITDDDFDVPTTIAAFGSSLYAVNARFGTPPTPDTAYDVVRVDR